MTQQRDHSYPIAMNLPELLIRVDNDRDLVCDLIRIFKEEFPRLRRLLQESVAREDTKRVETTSHTLTGMLSCLSATRAAAQAAQLEQMGRDGEKSGLANALMLFEHEVANLLPELDAYMKDVKP